jgi:hypothetical protein
MSPSEPELRRWYRRTVHQLPETEPLEPVATRIIGLMKFAGALGVACALWWFSGPMNILSEVLLLFGMSGLLELITGVSVSETALRWDALKPWQRGVASLLVILAAIGFVIALFALAAVLNE